LQLALTLGLVNTPRADEMLQPLLQEAAGRPELLEALLAGFAGREVEFLEARLKLPTWSTPEAWRERLLSASAGLLWRQRQPLAVLRLVHLVTGLPEELAWQQITLLEGLKSPPEAEQGGRRRGRFGGQGRAGFEGRRGNDGRGLDGRSGNEGRGGDGGRRGGRGAGRDRTPRLVTLPAAPEGLDQLCASANQQLAAAAQRLADQLIWPGKDGQPLPVRPQLSAEHQALYDLGRQEYMNLCAACHHAAGYGHAAKGPALLDSDWLESDGRLIRLVLHGMRGPLTIRDQLYNADGTLSMPGMYQALTDQKIAGILTFVRREWREDASPIEPQLVARIRAAHTDRTDQWTEAELLAIE
jgi:mono/diheme cytochrome c family protein